MTCKQMSTRRIALFATAMAVGGFSWTFRAVAADTTTQPSGSLAGTNGMSPGITNRDMAANGTGANLDKANGDLNGTIAQSDVEGIRNLLASFTDSALQQDAPQKLTPLFSARDRASLGGTAMLPNATPAMHDSNGSAGNGEAAVASNANAGMDKNPTGSASYANARAPQKMTTNTPVAAVDNSDLNKQIEQFRGDWQEKYHQPFGVTDRSVVYNSDTFRITPGDVGDQARTAGERIAPNGTSSTPNNAISNAASGTNMTPNGRTNAGANADLAAATGAKDSATVHIAASNGLSAVEVPVVRGMAADHWKVDASGALTQQQLHDRLLMQVNQLESAKANWPADVNDGYRVVSQHVLSVVNTSADNTTMQK